MTKIRSFFTRNQLEWTIRDVGRYNEELGREFYASYVETLQFEIDSLAALPNHAPLDDIRVHGKRVDISLPAIRGYLYGEDFDSTCTSLITEFDYRWKLVNDGRSCVRQS